jgi:hypothetical protein
MKKSDLACLLTLAALWGASYLFMRVGAGEFGALSMAGARAAGVSTAVADTGCCGAMAAWPSCAATGSVSHWWA